MIDFTCPVMRPVKIKTKTGLFKRIFAWVFETRKWELAEDYCLYVPFLKKTLFVPRKFVFDGASIPRLLWWISSPTGILFIPSLFHDLGYRYGGLVYSQDSNFIFKEYKKSDLDNILACMTEMINDMIMPGYIAKAGLMIGGWFAWQKCRREGKRFFLDFPDCLYK